MLRRPRGVTPVGDVREHKTVNPRPLHMRRVHPTNAHKTIIRQWLDTLRFLYNQVAQRGARRALPKRRQQPT
jgi:hypothetical protein